MQKLFFFVVYVVMNKEKERIPGYGRNTVFLFNSILSDRIVWKMLSHLVSDTRYNRTHSYELNNVEQNVKYLKIQVLSFQFFLDESTSNIHQTKNTIFFCLSQNTSLRHKQNVFVIPQQNRCAYQMTQNKNLYEFYSLFLLL